MTTRYILEMPIPSDALLPDAAHATHHPAPVARGGRCQPAARRQSPPHCGQRGAAHPERPGHRVQ